MLPDRPPIYAEAHSVYLLDGKVRIVLAAGRYAITATHGPRYTLARKILREQLRGRRLRLTDDQRRRLARKGRVLDRRVLAQIAGVVRPETILRWYRQLIAKKYDGTGKPG